MSFFQNLFSMWLGLSSDSDAIDSPPFHGGVNVDGTPMIDDSYFDINGDSYGCPSSLCNDDLGLIQDDVFDDDI